MHKLTAFIAVALAAVTLVAPASAKRVVHPKAAVHPKPVVCSLSAASGRTGKLVADATATFNDFRGVIPEYILRQAKGIVIVPALVKVGFIIGGQGGDAVLLRRNGNVWSYPAFYSLGSPSFGLQAGVSSAQVILVILSDRALAAVQQERFRLGSEAGIAVLTAGANGGATSYSGDIVVWARAAGAYLGVTVNDSTLEQKPEMNAEYYDRAVPFDDVFMGRACNANADALRMSVWQAGGGNIVTAPTRRRH
jgi:lipid-binding SYLF domain-containing protein